MNFDDSNYPLNSHYDSLINDMFNPHFAYWKSQIHNQQVQSAVTNPVYINSENSNLFSNATTTLYPLLFNSTLHSTTMSSLEDPAATYGANCSLEHLYLYNEAMLSFRPVILTLNALTYLIIVIGVLFNILNLVVLLNSKLNESPYTYLTILALSDLGALFMVAAEKAKLAFEQTVFIQKIDVYVISPAINIFLSCSMYITLALTIERFIFVYSPFKVAMFGRKSIARRVCATIFIFSFLRSLYLPFMYAPNCSNGFNQKSTKFIDIYEFLISLAIPYTIIFIANISLIQSLKKQNNLMNVSLFSTNSFSLNGGFSTSNGSNNTLNKSMTTTRTKRSDTIISTELHSLFEINEQNNNSNNCTTVNKIR